MANAKNYPLFKVNIDKAAALSRLDSVFDSGFVNEGKEVAELTARLRTVLGSEQIVLMNSCTSALTVALRLAGVKPGKNVVTSPMTCIASNTPIINLGGDIKWADVDPKSGMITPETVESLIDSDTVAVLFVDWAGVMPDLANIDAVCRKKGVKLIQDAAHAFGAEYNGKPVCQYSDFTCFSFQAIKHFTCGDGGALVCRDPKDQKIASNLKWFGYDRASSKDEKGNWRVQQAEADITEGEVGYKFNMNNVAAAIGLAQIPHIDGILVAHRRNADTYDRAFLHSPHISPILRPNDSKPSFWVYTTLLADGIDRDAVMQSLAQAGIHSGQVHVPNDEYTCFARFQRSLPGVREFSRRQLSLPSGWWITESDASFIAQKTIDIVRN